MYQESLDGYVIALLHLFPWNGHAFCEALYLEISDWFFFSPISQDLIVKTVEESFDFGTVFDV